MEYINIKKLIDIIRKEYRQHANTKERVANVLDEILKFTYDNYQVKGEYVTNDALLEYLNGKVNTDGSNIEDIETWQLVLDFYSKNESDLRYKSIDYIPSWSEITDKPSSFNPSPHNHSIGDVDGLNDQINLIKTDIEIINEDYVNLLQEVDEVLQALDNKEDKANKQNDLTPDGTGTKYPTVDAVNNGFSGKQDKLSTISGNVGVGKSDASASEKLDVNGNVKSNSYKFTLPSAITAQPNMLIPKTDGTRPIWYNNSSVGNDLAFSNEVDGKLNKPTTTSNTTSYPYVVGEDGNGNSARLPAGDLGKNFFNSDLSNTTARNHTMNAGVTVNTLGNPHTLSGLPNKNTDIANFRKVRVQNTSGLDSVVDSKNLLTDAVTSMSDAEKDAWRLAQRKTGETYSIGQPRIDFVFPSYINNSITYVQPLVLYGINLYIDNQTPNSIVQLNRVEDINGNAVNELYNITNFEVSPLKTNQIVLMLDWSIYPKGKYKFKVLNNSLQSLVSDGFVILNDSVPNQISNLTWTVNTNPTQAANSSVLNVSNKSFSYERKAISAGITEATHTMYSNEELSGNFVVELNVGLGQTFMGYVTQSYNVYDFGLIASSSSSSSFSLAVLNGFEFRWLSDNGGIFVTDKGQFTDSQNLKLGSGGKMYFLKFQGYITICFITNTGNLIFLSSAIASNEPLRLFNRFFNQGRFLNQTVSFSYGQIFTY